MISLLRTDSKDVDFISLVKALDVDLARRDGEEHAYYAQYNKIDNIDHVLVAYDKSKALACGAIKEFDNTTVEVKRMFVLPEVRGNGYGKQVLAALERWAFELNYATCKLETGKRQPEAMRLYQSMGYEIIPNYGQYKGVENSVCFEKQIK